MVLYNCLFFMLGIIFIKKYYQRKSSIWLFFAFFAILVGAFFGEHLVVASLAIGFLANPNSISFRTKNVLMTWGW